MMNYIEMQWGVAGNPSKENGYPNEGNSNTSGTVRGKQYSLQKYGHSVSDATTSLSVSMRNDQHRSRRQVKRKKESKKFDETPLVCPIQDPCRRGSESIRLCESRIGVLHRSVGPSGSSVSKILPLILLSASLAVLWALSPSMISLLSISGLSAVISQSRT
jgi:hypothetical protein